MVERTLILVKPDGVQRGLIGEIIARFERRGLQVVGLKFMSLSNALARAHYKEHVGKPFFKSLVDYITSCPIVAMVLEGPKAIELCRATIGATDPLAATPGSIRGDFGATIGRNLVHGSDGARAAKREIKLFFRPSELSRYNLTATRWIVE
jgi:nucleoside-diphosphate kinase